MTGYTLTAALAFGTAAGFTIKIIHPEITMGNQFTLAFLVSLGVGACIRGICQIANRK